MSKKPLTVDISFAIPTQESEEQTSPGARRSTRKALHRTQAIVAEDVVIDEELSTPLDASPLAMETGPFDYTFVETRA
ncbi:hypothetical protein GOP47_0022418 [Adiantum capillus-veneris]|uniref:Uncharacterized protein n=1 Tax=Adiantum capillus-veneris TaxID=13818 RepID=A0A9D4U5B0_ADICA|nr:hypothetical protein GOP47_0022418 [Adiantum capillus-veneris]